VCVKFCKKVSADLGSFLQLHLLFGSWRSHSSVPATRAVRRRAQGWSRTRNSRARQGLSLTAPSATASTIVCVGQSHSQAEAMDHGPLLWRHSNEHVEWACDFDCIL